MGDSPQMHNFPKLQRIEFVGRDICRLLTLWRYKAQSVEFSGIWDRIRRKVREPSVCSVRSFGDEIETLLYKHL